MQNLEKIFQSLKRLVILPQIKPSTKNEQQENSSGENKQGKSLRYYRLTLHFGRQKNVTYLR